MSLVSVTPRLAIPADELEFSFARSGGPGGQHVNTSSTKVELRFDVDGSPTLDAEQKAAIKAHLANRITSEGVLVLTSSEYRSQTRNREAVTARFAALLAEALTPRRPRRPTRPNPAARRRRLERKRRQSERKALRKPPPPSAE
jgi:ribosome-associated protein